MTWLGPDPATRVNLCSGHTLAVKNIAPFVVMVLHFPKKPKPWRAQRMYFFLDNPRDRTDEKDGAKTAGSVLLETVVALA